MFQKINSAELRRAAMRCSAGKSLTQNYNYLSDHTPEIAIWFAPGREELKIRGEHVDANAIQVNTQLRALTSFFCSRRTGFAGWLRDDFFRHGQRDAYKCRERIRIITVPDVCPSEHTVSRLQAIWISKNDSPQKETLGIDEALLSLRLNRHGLSGVDIQNVSSGDILHAFNLYPLREEFDPIAEPFDGFEGMQTPAARTRLTQFQPGAGWR